MQRLPTAKVRIRITIIALQTIARQLARDIVNGRTYETKAAATRHGLLAFICLSEYTSPSPPYLIHP